MIEQFFQMGGYGGYVWPAYAVSALTLGGLAWLTLRRWSRVQRRLREFERRQAANHDDA